MNGWQDWKTWIKGTYFSTLFVTYKNCTYFYKRSCKFKKQEELRDISLQTLVIQFKILSLQIE